jgi:hypothetical protein
MSRLPELLYWEAAYSILEQSSFEIIRVNAGELKNLFFAGFADTIS